jgi:hypothetical protein
VTKGRNVTSNSRETGYPIMWFVSGDQGKRFAHNVRHLDSFKPNGIAPLADQFRWSGAGVYLKLTQAVRAA